MGRRNAWLWLIGLAVLIAGAATPVFAKEAPPSYRDGVLRKLGRGLANVATCPAELIRTPELTGRKEGAVSALSVGILHGVWRTLLRGVTGVFEVATFFVEIPDNFEPLLLPEFVYAHGDWAE